MKIAATLIKPLNHYVLEKYIHNCKWKLKIQRVNLKTIILIRMKFEELKKKTIYNYSCI